MNDGEQREHPRVEFDAEVRVATDPAIELTTRNISMGGVFIAGDPAQHPQLKVGTHVQLALHVAEIVGRDFACRAQVTRVDTGSGGRTGFALRFFSLDMANTIRLAKLIEHTHAQEARLSRSG